jgi:hypothetical protein
MWDQKLFRTKEKTISDNTIKPRFPSKQKIWVTKVKKHLDKFNAYLVINVRVKERSKDWDERERKRERDRERKKERERYLHPNFLTLVTVIFFVMCNILAAIFFKLESRPGWPDEFVKNSPKMLPKSIFCQNKYTTFTVEESSPKIWAVSVSFIKLPKVNNRPIG